MTSEICVMNRLGVVLAADSASTVRQATNDGPKERYFKGANKIFQLSNHHPVGVMIFDSADQKKETEEAKRIKAESKFAYDAFVISFNNTPDYKSEALVGPTLLPAH